LCGIPGVGRRDVRLSDGLAATPEREPMLGTPQRENPRMGFFGRFLYGLAFGGLVATLAAVLDAIALTACGTNIPWKLPFLVVGSYYVLGVVGGGFLAVVTPLLAGRGPRATEADHVRAMIRRTVLATCCVVIVAIFVERVSTPSLKQLGEGFGPAALTVAGIGWVVAILLASRLEFKWFLAGGAVWPVIWLMSFCILWEPVNRLYKAPVLSTTSLLANLAYWVLALTLMLVVRAIAIHLPSLLPVERVGPCCSGTALVGAIGLMVSSCVLWCVKDKPIDQPYREWAEAADIDTLDNPNVILIVLDTVRADHLSCYGYPRNTTPNLKAFADEAVRYEHAIATSSWTVPTHGSLFTGLMPSEHGAHRRTEAQTEADGLYQPLAEHNMTLAEILADNGYYTGSVVGNSGFLKRELGFAQGFFYYDDRDRAVISTAMPGVFSPALWWCELYKRIVHGDWNWRRAADDVTDSAMAWMGRDVGRPLFLFVNYMDAHTPYRAHPEFDQQLGISGSSVRSEPAQPPAGKSPGKPDPGMQQDIDRYDSEIAYIDAYLGKLFACLKERDLYDHSLIIVTSDHGESFGEHGMVDHGNAPYEEEVHVPLIIRYPGGRMNGSKAEATSLANIMPTVLDYLQIEHPDPTWLARVPKRNRVMAEVRPFKDRFGRSQGGWVSRALYENEGMKVITQSVVTGQAELYDLSTDPCETRDLASQKRGLVERATNWLEVWYAEVVSRRPDHDETAQLSQGLVQKLRSIGYVN